MSAMLEPNEPVTEVAGSPEETAVVAPPVIVRRNAGLLALVGAAASALAIAYLWRASQSGRPLDWLVFVVMAVVAAGYLSSLLDSRTPLLVADHLGLRIRLAREWRGLPWEAVARVEVRPRKGMLSEGRLVVTPASLGRGVDGLDARGRRAASLNQKRYGAALAVPMGLTTRVSTEGERSVADGLAALTRGNTEVVELPGQPARPARSPRPARGTPKDAVREQRGEADEERHGQPSEPLERGLVESEPVVPEPVAPEPLAPEQPRRRLLGGIGVIVSRVAKRQESKREEPVVPDRERAAAPEAGRTAGPASAVPLRQTRPAARAHVTRDLPATLGTAALQDRAGDEPADDLPERRELHRPGSVDLVFESAPSSQVRPIALPGEPVEPLVIDDFVTEPAYDPVIGPELAAARTRLGLSVDDLSERTRIRPHVIESIEVDDFAPCGGDFYARGHLRTLARVLGQNPQPLLASYEERYATAPVSARRVFEAELATGMTGSMRSTVGGPRWGLLTGVVLVLVIVWGVVRLFATTPVEVLQTPPPVLQAPARVHSAYAAAGRLGPVAHPLPLTLVAAHAGSHVVVRNGSGEVVFAGDLVLGEKKALHVVPPVRVQAGNAGAIEVQVKGKDRGVLGVLDTPGRRTFGGAAH